MQLIIFIGIQATGKSTFYRQHFFNSHVRISMDLLNTRNKEDKFLEVCMNTHSKLVVDNTNPTQKERKKYIELAKANKYEVVGYYFRSVVEESLQRNALRTGKERIPDVGIRGCYGKLEMPSLQEGFDRLYFVKMQNDSFSVEEWRNEV